MARLARAIAFLASFPLLIALVAAAVFAGSPADAPRDVHLLTGPDYYEAIGRADLAREYRVRRAERWALIGSGAALVATAVVLLGSGVAKYCSPEEQLDPCSATWSSGNRDLGFLLFAAGSFLIAGGAVLDPDPVWRF